MLQVIKQRRAICFLANHIFEFLERSGGYCRIEGIKYISFQKCNIYIRCMQNIGPCIFLSIKCIKGAKAQVSLLMWKRL